MASRRDPDQRLRALLSEAGWTGAQLAGAVNALGAEAGLVLRYDRTSVAHWLAGSSPNPPVPELITEALQSRLGREIRPGALQGPGPWPGTRPPAQTGQDAAAGLEQLHAARATALRGGIYTLAALAIPGWELAQAAALPARARSGARTGRQQARTVSEMVRVFSDVDAAFGGGRAVTALSGYLAADIAPKLRAPATPLIRREIYAAATQLAYLCGFMHFDQEHHGAAQRYYTIALALATENHDPAGYATALRALSVQAHTLGHHQQARNLAESALAGAPGNLTAHTRAFLHGQVAVAAAGTGDRRTAVTHLTRAETLLARATPSAPASAITGDYHEAALAHQRSAVLAALGDTPGAAAALAASLRQRPATERRARAVTLAALAGLQTRQGHLEQAASTWHRFLADYPHLDCGRATTALAQLRTTLRPHQRNPAAAEVWAQATKLARTRGNGR